MPRSMSELYAEYPVDPMKVYWPSKSPVEVCVASSEDLNHQTDPLAYLDETAVSDSRKAKNVYTCLTNLPGEVVVYNFGKDVAMWAVASEFAQQEADPLREALTQNNGFDPVAFKAARHFIDAKYQDKKRFGATVISQYDLIKDIEDRTALEAVDLLAILRDSVKPDVEVSSDRIDQYGLTPLVPHYNSYWEGGTAKDWRDVTPTLTYEMWVDSPIGFALTHKGLPIAMAGIAANGAEEIMVHQLQGVQGHKVDPSKSRFDKDRVLGTVKPHGLAPFDWQRILTKATEAIAGENDMDSTAIQSGVNNVWTRPRMQDPEPHLPVEKAVAIYDGTAQRLGYTKLEDDARGNWHHTIT